MDKSLIMDKPGITSLLVITDLPVYVCQHIITFINNSMSYKNLRISCSFFYHIMERLKIYHHDTKNLYKLICFKNSLVHGQFTSFYNNKSIFKRYQYYYGLREGTCNTYYKNGNIKQSTEYKLGTKHGSDILYFYTGGIHKITNYKKNVKFSNEIVNNFDGSLNCVINFSNIPSNYLLTKYLKNKKISITFNNNLINGPVILTDTKNHITDISEFVHGELHGTYKKFNKGNITSLLNYSFGKRHGLAYYWDEYNIKKMCNYKFNMLDGILKYWGEHLQLDAIFKNNNLTKGIYYFNTTKIDLDYQDNKPHGYYIEHHYNDIIKYRIKFKYGIFDKIFKKYYFTGSIQSEYIYHDEHNFTITNYDINGIVKFKIIKKNTVYNIYHKYVNKSLTYTF